MDTSCDAEQYSSESAHCQESSHKFYRLWKQQDLKAKMYFLGS